MCARARFRTQLQALLYLADFEHLQIPMTVRDFVNSDKEGLVRSLWRAHGRDPQVRACTSLPLNSAPPAP